MIDKVADGTPIAMLLVFSFNGYFPIARLPVVALRRQGHVRPHPEAVGLANVHGKRLIVLECLGHAIEDGMDEHPIMARIAHLTPCGLPVRLDRLSPGNGRSRPVGIDVFDLTTSDEPPKLSGQRHAGVTRQNQGRFQLQEFTHGPDVRAQTQHVRQRRPLDQRADVGCQRRPVRDVAGVAPVVLAGPLASPQEAGITHDVTGTRKPIHELL